MTYLEQYQPAELGTVGDLPIGTEVRLEHVGGVWTITGIDGDNYIVASTGWGHSLTVTPSDAMFLLNGKQV